MIKLIKWLILIVIVAGIVLWFTDVKVRGRSLKERVDEFKQTELYREGVRDMRSIVGEALKALGEEVSGDVTDDERQELEKVIKQEMTQDSTTTPPEGATTWQQQPLKPVPQRPPQQANPSAPSPAR